MMRTLHAILLLVMTGLTACSSGGANNEPQSNNAQAKTVPDDIEIMAKAYDITYLAPDYFYVDERADTPRSFSLYHLKDTSISYERCSNDYDEAFAWESIDNESRSVGGYYVGSYENERYFEFVRELAYPDGVGNVSDPTSPGFARVFKCSYVDRTGADRNLHNGYAGTLNVRPLSMDAIRTYSEYMWQFTFFWPATKTVLETYSEEKTNTYQHTLVLAFMTNQGADRCDLIEVVDWVFTVDKVDGTITKEFRLQHQLEARLVNGAPEIC